MGIDTKDTLGRIVGRTNEIGCYYRGRGSAQVLGEKRDLLAKSLLIVFVLGWLWLANEEVVAAQSGSGRGAATNPTPTANSQLQQTTVPADSEEYRIRAGDILNVSVFQEPELSQMVKVPQSGSIRYSLLGVIQVKNLTTSEAEKKITELLAKDYLVNPRVSITVETNKSRRVVTVLGEVKQPGAIEIPDQEQVTLLQLIGRAGGFTNIAATDRVTIIRTENGKEQVIRVNVSAIIKSSDKSKDIELKPGDVVSVPESFF